MLDNELSKNSKRRLKKHVNAIHCVNKFSLLQRKLFNALLFNAYPQLPHQSQFEIPIKNLCTLIGYKSNDSKKLKEALLSLMTLAIEWDVCEFSSKLETDKWKASVVLSSAKFCKGICIYEYSSLIRKLFYQPEIYGRLDMETLSKFKSSYGISLYENCVRFQGLKTTPWFCLEEFRKLMGVLDGKYLDFKDLKKRVISIATSEVNKFSEISIAPEFKKRGRKIEKIRFYLEPKNKKLNSSSKYVSGNTDIVNLKANVMEKIGLSEVSVNSIFSNHDLDYIKEKFEFIKKSQPYSEGKIKNLAGYFIEALNKDYKCMVSQKDELDKKRQLREKAYEEKIREKDLSESIADAYDKYRNNLVKSFFSNLSESEKEDLLMRFKKTLNNFFLSAYKREGLDHPIVTSLFDVFVCNLEEKPIKDFLTLEEFKKNKKEFVL